MASEQCDYCGFDAEELAWKSCPLQVSPCGKMQAQLDALYTENERLKAALKTVGDDYPGSSCQRWCYEQAGISLPSETPVCNVQSGEPV